MDRNLVFLLGAGSTAAEATSLSDRRRPPLDAGFFRVASRTDPKDTANIQQHIWKHYGVDICARDHDFLEQVVAMVYTDSFHPTIGQESFEIFRDLVRLYSRRIASTTNPISPKTRSFLFRMIARFLESGLSTSQITFVTYNQDIQIEKALDLFTQIRKYDNFAPFLSFPQCYGIRPRDVTRSSDVPYFPPSTGDEGGPRVLKLHGSLNWYSTHTSPNPLKNQLFNPKRGLQVSASLDLDPYVELMGRKDKWTFPVVVPPITHKAAIFHNAMGGIWRQAETALSAASDIVIFGYSCPPTDAESSNMLARALSRNQVLQQIIIIDPTPQTLLSYIQRFRLSRVKYYATAKDFLDTQDWS